jgi:hypothetical protein
MDVSPRLQAQEEGDDGADEGGEESEDDGTEEGEGEQDTGDDGWDDWGEPEPAPQPETVATGPEREPVRTDMQAYKSGGMFGLGFVVGTINGLSMKLWPRQAHGIVLNVGGAFLLNSLVVAASYRFHFRPIVVPESPVSMHLQLGPRFRTRISFQRANVDLGIPAATLEVGGSVVVGLSIVVRDVPAEVYLEVATGAAGNLVPPLSSLGVDFGGGTGARFFF